MARFTMIIPLPISTDDPGLPAQGLVRGVANEVRITGLTPLSGEVVVFASGEDGWAAQTEPGAVLPTGRADATGTVRLMVTPPACVAFYVVAVPVPNGTSPRVTVDVGLSCRAA